MKLCAKSHAGEVQWAPLRFHIEALLKAAHKAFKNMSKCKLYVERLYTNLFTRLRRRFYESSVCS